MITVLMSVFNDNLNYLKESICSILDQSYKDFEFLIFDDCSNDDVKKLLEEFSEKDERIKLIRNDTNKGLTHNLHKGVILAKGKYICRQDSDDISLPNRLEKELVFMEEHRDIAVAGSRFYTLKGQLMKKSKTNSCFSNNEVVKANLFFRNIIMHGSVIIRKGALLENNLNYNPNIRKSQDFDLWFRVSLKLKIVIMNDYLCVYRIHNNQISTNYVTKTDQKKYYESIIVKHLELLFGNVNEELVDTHISLINCNRKIRLGTIKNWCKTLKEKNNEKRVFDEKVFNKVVSFFYYRFLVKKMLCWR